MRNGITDPRDPDFIPYYQRQGLDAEGVSSEFMETWRKKSSEILARTRPESREAVRIGLGEFAQGQYANLKSYEMREVRRGKVDAITQGAEEAAVRTAWSVCGQAAADLRAREKEREDAQKEYDEVARTFPRSFVDVMPDPQDKANAERWLKEAAARRDERLKQADEAFAASARNRFFEAVQGIEDAGRQFDAGVADMLFDEREGAARKRKAARAAIGGVVGSLIEGGSLDVAERFVDSLENEKDVDGKSPVAMRYGFLPEDIGKMREAVKSARVRAKAESERALREAERQTLDGIELASREAMADGSLGSIEDALAKMKAEAEAYPGGSRPRVAAMEWARRLDGAADAAAKRDCWDAIIDHAADGAKWNPPKGSRMAKFHKALKESFDRQAAAYAAEGILAEDAARKEERKANEAALRASMLSAAAVDPGGFSAVLADAAEKGHITLDQYRRLRDEFRDTWMQKGMPEKGAALVQILEREFYAGKDYVLNNRLAVNPKTGRFEYLKNPDTKKPFEGEDVEFETAELVSPPPSLTINPLGYGPTGRVEKRQPYIDTTTRTLTSDEQLDLLGWAMELAQHDGEWISTDPQTGVRLEKPRKLDAAAEFQDACTRLKSMKRAQTARDLSFERANAMLNLRAGFAQADAATTGAAAKREASEQKARETLKTTKRRPFAPKMPGVRGGGLQPADEDTED